MNFVENFTAGSNYTLVEQWAVLYTQDLYAYAFRKTSDHTLSEDLIQDTLLTALQAIEAFERRSSPKTWLMAILNHKIMDHFRREGRSPIVQLADLDGLLNEYVTEDHLLDDPEFRMLLQNCINLLPSHWREIIRLRYLEEEDSKTICKRLKISITSYWQIISRARSGLRRLINERRFKE